VKRRIEWDGDHVGYVLTPVEASFGDDGPWLTFQQLKDIDPGHDA
jgi:hypothetical protein